MKSDNRKKTAPCLKKSNRSFSEAFVSGAHPVNVPTACFTKLAFYVLSTFFAKDANVSPTDIFAVISVTT
jgi:hypothetical protein